MKILSIKGKNLASIEGEFHLDFTVKPLSNAGIFAITGITGAGKSTILDALCLALYARTPRQKAAKENTIKVKDGKDGYLGQSDPRLIMRKGCHEAMAEVTFVGIDSRSYTASWSVRRARNQSSGQMQDYCMSLIEHTFGQLIPGRKSEIMKEIERLAGMTFDQFTRSVLLAQGEFTTFLKADQNEKSELLEKLTGTEIYSKISSLVHIKTKEAEQDVKEVESKLGELKLLTLDEVNFYRQELETLRSEITSLKSRQTDLSGQVNWRLTLDRLSKDLEEAKISLMQSIEEKDASIPRYIFLSKVERVQVSRSLVQGKNSFQNALHQNLSGIKNTLEKLDALEQNISLNRNKLSTAEALYQSALQKNADAKKDLIIARELDTKLTSLTKVCKNSAYEKDLFKKKLEETKTELQNKTKELNFVTNLIKDINDWLSKNESRKLVAENIKLILSKLGEASSNLSRQTVFENKIVESNKIISSNLDEINLLKQDKKDKQLRFEELSLQYKEYSKVISKLDPEKLEIDKEACNNSLKELSALLINCEKINQLEQTLEDIEVKITLYSNNITATESRLSEVSSDLVTSDIKKKQTEKLLLDAKLKSSDNINDLRNNLKQGEPCILCGSTEHPYATQNDKLHSILEIIENEYHSCEEDYRNLLQLQSGLASDKQHFLNNKKELSDQFKNTQELLSKLVNEWQCLDKHDKFQEIPITFKITSIKEEYVAIESSLREINSKLIDVKELSTILETLKLELNSLTESISSSNEAFSKKNSLVLLHQQQLEQANEELDICTENINRIEQEVGIWFSKGGWINAWRSDPDKFTNELTNFSNAWNEKISSLIEKEQLLEILSVQKKSLESQLAERINEFNQQESKLDEIEEELKELSNQRAVFFNGKTCNDAEKELFEKETFAKKALEQQKLLTDALIKEQGLLNGTLLQLENDKTRYEEVLKEASAKLDYWLQEYNSKAEEYLDENTLYELLNISPSWISQERTELAILADKVLRVQATYDERADQVRKHESSNESVPPLDELNESIKVLTVKIDELTKSESSLSFKLAQDEHSRQQSSSYLDEIKKRDIILTRWNKLDDLIGSADGKKFRQIAQKYTLEILLGYANKHLLNLSPRYNLQCVQDTLALQVIDHDMGDEVRSVHYLSGGESFLVSLALALGLASLSSNRMKVESLFIDEGFGSLDPETLRTAMDALERLHNDGRKVGVISHVQEMTERIPVQVRVIKLAGKSKVEIIG